jgi:hypothetical protein
MCISFWLMMHPNKVNGWFHTRSVAAPTCEDLYVTVRTSPHEARETIWSIKARENDKHIRYYRLGCWTQTSHRHINRMDVLIY